MNEINIAEELTVRLPCGHIYHIHCLLQMRQPKCPICRHVFPEVNQLQINFNNLEGILTSDEDEEDEAQLPIFPPIMMRHPRRRQRAINPWRHYEPVLERRHPLLRRPLTIADIILPDFYYDN